MILVAQAILILIENWYTISYRNFIVKMYLFLKLKPLIKLYVNLNGKCFHQSLVPKLQIFIVRLTSFNWLRLLSSEWFKTPEYNYKSLKYWITATFCELHNPGKKKQQRNWFVHNDNPHFCQLFIWNKLWSIKTSLTPLKRDKIRVSLLVSDITNTTKIRETIREKDLIWHGCFYRMRKYFSWDMHASPCDLWSLNPMSSKIVSVYTYSM